MYLQILIILSLALIFDDVSGSTMRKNVVRGETVVFECTLSEGRPPGDIDWLIEWSNGEILKTNARKSQPVNSPKLSKRGHYATSYRSSGAVIRHVCKLTITNVNLHDQGNFSCIHDGWFSNRGRFFHSSLVVTSPPQGSPKCSFSPIEDNGLDISIGSVVRLICYLEDDESRADLAWFRDENERIHTKTGNRIEMDYPLQDVDNGVNFVCTSSGESEEQKCQIMPFEQLPNVTIEPLTLPLVSQSDGTFTCCGAGIPRISRYEWNVNGYLVKTGKEFGITSKGNCNELRIFNVTRRSNGTKVTCEVSNPTGLTASAIATILVLEDERDHSITSIPTIIVNPSTLKITSPSQTRLDATVNNDSRDFKSTTISVQNKSQLKESSPFNPSQRSDHIIPIVIAVAVGIGITIIFIVALFVRRRLKYEQSHYQKDRTVHCQPNVSQITFSTPDILYESTVAYHGPTKTDESSTIELERNVEGLTYASLDLNPPVNDNEVLNPSSLEAVMYADIKNDQQIS